VIFGVGKERENLEAQGKASGLGNAVRFPGRIKNPYAVFRKAGLYVSSSRYEGFPNALCEAMACGLPVIATDCPSGPREIITDGVDGLLVPNEDVDALAAAMIRMMGDEALRRGLGTEAAKITERFGVDAVMRRWEAVLRERCGVRV
jgi:glycosyltransferase involved in cell wall biosynthesis